MAGITVRTLHHYDEIGLLEPSARTPGGYRLYDEAAVERLRTILTYRELGLSLEETTGAIDGDAKGALRLARDRVFRQIAHLEQIAASLSRSLNENLKSGESMTTNDKLSVFGNFDSS
jgi:MerR family transcriptional regulator, thiopeptide resistance regulator